MLQVYLASPHTRATFRLWKILSQNVTIEWIYYTDLW